MKSPPPGGEGVVVSHTGRGRLEMHVLGWFLQFSINCKNGRQSRPGGFPHTLMCVRNLLTHKTSSFWNQGIPK